MMRRWRRRQGRMVGEVDGGGAVELAIVCSNEAALSSDNDGVGIRHIVRGGADAFVGGYARAGGCSRGHACAVGHSEAEE